MFKKQKTPRKTPRGFVKDIHPGRIIDPPGVISYSGKYLSGRIGAKKAKAKKETVERADSQSQSPGNARILGRVFTYLIATDNIAFLAECQWAIGLLLSETCCALSPFGLL